MTRALKTVLGAELIVGVFWTVLAAMAHGAGGLAVFGLFLFVYALYATFFVFAAWVYWKYPGERKIAGWIMALPILFWFLPMIIRSMAGGVLSTPQLVQALLVFTAVALLICWIAPRKAAVAVPKFLLQSRLFNWTVILAVIAGWLLFVVVLLYVAGTKSPSTSGTGEGLALALVLAAIYLFWLGVGSLGAATWAWLSLRGGIRNATRKLNIAQLVVAVPGVLIGILVALWSANQK